MNRFPPNRIAIAAVVVLALFVCVERAQAISGTITSTLTISDDSQLVGDGAEPAGNRPQTWYTVLSNTRGMAVTSGAHFFSVSDSIAENGVLVVSFDEGGLGKVSGQVTYTLNADVTANYACINTGGNQPKASNKETVSAPVTVTAEFTPATNGRVIASISTSPLAPPADFSCPGGQTLILASVAYTDVVLTDTTSNIAVHPSSISRTFVNL